MRSSRPRISTGCARFRRPASTAIRCFSVMRRRRATKSTGWRPCSRTARYGWRRWRRSRRRQKAITQPLILCAHTHVARAARLADGRLVINPGSVGSPGYRDIHPFPHVIEAGTPDAATRSWNLPMASGAPTFRHVPYDHDGDGGAGAGNGQPRAGLTRWRLDGSGKRKTKRPAIRRPSHSKSMLSQRIRPQP